MDLLRGDVLAHLETEERVLYEAARRVGARALMAALELDRQFLLSLVERIDKADTGLDAALSARAMVVLFALRMEKERRDGRAPHAHRGRCGRLSPPRAHDRTDGN